MGAMSEFWPNLSEILTKTSGKGKKELAWVDSVPSTDRIPLPNDGKHTPTSPQGMVEGFLVVFALFILAAGLAAGI
jgi:hypothetical protein